MKKLLKLAMLGMALRGGRRYKNGMDGGYGYGMGYPAMGYMPYRARKRMKRKMQKRMVKHALRRIF